MEPGLNKDLLSKYLAPKAISLIETKHVNGNAWATRVEVKILGNSVFLLALSSIEMGMLPVVQLLPTKTNIYRLSHISEDGTVCYSDQEGIGFVPDEPERLLADVLSDCAKIVEQSFIERQNKDWGSFYDEFEGYWNTLENTINTSLVSDPATNNRLYATISRHGNRLSITRIGVYNAVEKCEGSLHHVTFIRLNSEPPPPHKSYLSLSDWLKAILAEHNLDRLLIRRGVHVFLFEQARPGGGHSLFGVITVVRYRQKARAYSVSATPIAIGRAWREFLLERASVPAFEKSVAIVGCGALGSRIAEMLVLSGVKELTLVDYDVLKEENVFRHVLGLDSVGDQKVLGLKRELKKKRPGLVIETVQKNGLAWIRGLPQKKCHDVIVLATGNSPVERLIYKQVYGNRNSDLICSTWLEPAGLGGHITLSRVGDRGCLECLFTDIEGNSVSTSRVALLEPGQKFSRNLTGCGGAFTPFTPLDVNRTAQIVVESLLRNFTGYKGWAASKNVAEASKLILSHRYRQLCSTGTSIEDINSDIIAQKGCTCCGT